jgi:hypothetical protein
MKDMSYSRQRIVEEIRQACIADDPSIEGTGRPVVLDDVLKSVPMEDGSFDRNDGDYVFISVAGYTPGGERIRLKWHRAKPLTGQSDETLRVIGELNIRSSSARFPTSTVGHGDGGSEQ